MEIALPKLLSSVGLGLDLIGVALLTWDLYPEFVLTRARRAFRERLIDLRFAAMESVHAVKHRAWWMYTVDPVLVRLQNGDYPSSIELDWTSFSAAVVAMRFRPGWRENFIRGCFQDATRLRGGPPIPGIDPIDARLIGSGIQVNAHALRYYEERAGARLRPPLALAAVAIVAGFTLQLVGTLLG